MNIKTCLFIICSLLFTSFAVAAPSSTIDAQFLDAAAKGQIEKMKVLLAKGANIEAKDDSGDTALMHETLSEQFARGDIKVVRWLIAHKANVNIRNERGATALMSAAASGREEIVILLLKHGADIKARDKEGQTALMHSVDGIGDELGNTMFFPDITRLLLKKGADVNAKDNAGQTALILVAKSDSYDKTESFSADDDKEKVELARLLLSRGAKIDVKTKNGNTALKWATLRRHWGIVKLLKSKAA